VETTERYDVRCLTQEQQQVAIADDNVGLSFRPALTDARLGRNGWARGVSGQANQGRAG
jgi:hypothetical protein